MRATAKPQKFMDGWRGHILYALLERLGASLWGYRITLVQSNTKIPHALAVSSRSLPRASTSMTASLKMSSLAFPAFRYWDRAYSMNDGAKTTVRGATLRTLGLALRASARLGSMLPFAMKKTPGCLSVTGGRSF